jgi:antitoxin component of RelBE/YafQ-DinJ toxin-antitoxin module
MRDDYKIKGTTARLQVEVEKDVVERIQAMEKYTGLSVSELANTALKRFITHHSDFMPVEKKKA